MQSDRKLKSFCFYLVQEIEGNIESIRLMVESLRCCRKWTIDAPYFICEIDSGSDECVLGGGVLVYSALEEDPLPIELDTKNYQDVMALLEALAVLSRSKALSFECFLDSTYVGEVGNGEFDKLLRVGLMENWINNLGEA